MLKQTDKALLAALLAMAGQVADENVRARVTSAIRGEEQKPAPVVDVIRQKVVTGDEAARILNCTRRTVVTLANSGAIRRALFPGRTKACGYLRESVEALVAGGAA